MNFTKVLSFLFLLFLSANLVGQSPTLSGKVTDGITGEPLIGATVQIGDTGTTTDFDGNYTLTLAAGEQTIEASYIGYESVSKVITAAGAQELNFELGEEATLLQTATVTSGKFEKPLSEVTVSLEVVKAQLLENTNSTSVDDVLQKVPGVQIIDGQANIRGGSGFSYGAGSRVLLLVDDIPILQADAGTPNWDDIPVENVEQIEVIKGAASSLYGSSALNGVINVRTGYAKSTPETKLATFYTTFNEPADAAQTWDGYNANEFGFSALHKRKFKKLDLVASGYYLDRDSYNKTTYAKYGRGNLKLRYRFTDRLSAGINTNFNSRDASDFFYWKSLDSLFVNAPNTISVGKKIRYNIDPFITYFDESGNRHKLIGRYLNINNKNNNNQANASQLWYSEYQFNRKWAGDWVTTAGLVYTANFVNAELYGDTTFRTRNLAAYAQLEKKFFDKLNVSAGFRFEDNKLTTPENFCRLNGLGQEICDTIPGGQIAESRPVFRLGMNYQAAQQTFLRASWGQGYRFPTIAESFIVTTFGPVPVSPNPSLGSETGWSTEIGIKQGFRADKFQGYLDIAAFWSEYQDMIEFNLIDFFSTGFQSLNVGDTKIQGFEATVVGKGSLFGLPTNVLAGYTYLEPKFKEFDTTPIEAGGEGTEGQQNAKNSSSDQNILKYRSRHSGKVDIESTYKNFSIGLAGIYTSQIVAVDDVFQGFIGGLREFRAANMNGNFIPSARISYKFLREKAKFSLVANNFTNKMYSIRPGIMEAPRSITGRLDYSF